MRLKRTRSYLFLSWMLLITVLSLVPTPGGALAVSDKLAHFGVYFATALLAVALLGLKGMSPVVLGCAGVVLYGALIEVAQYFLPYRSFSVGDMAANTGGALAFGLTWLVAGRQATRFSETARAPSDGVSDPRPEAR